MIIIKYSLLPWAQESVQLQKLFYKVIIILTKFRSSLPYFFGYKMEFFHSKTIPKVQIHLIRWI